MAYTMLEYVKETLGHLFDYIDPINQSCIHCKAQIHKAGKMSDEGCEAGAWKEYHFCNCPEAVLVRDEIRDRPRQLVSICTEFHLERDRMVA